MRVTSTPAASRHVRERGGTLYVTLDGATGGARVSTDAPGEVVDTDGTDGGGYLLVYDRRLAMPAELHVTLARGGPVLAAAGAGDPARVSWWEAVASA